MNGYYQSTNFIGALGENNLISTINNNQTNSSNYTYYTSNGLNDYVWNVNNTLKNRLTTDESNITTIQSDISGINSSISTIEGEITTLQGEVATNTTDIITANGLIAANSAAITANGIITTANTISIGTLNSEFGTCLTNSMVQSGDIGLFYAGTSLNLVYNSTHFYDASVLGTNRQFTLTSTYANLPTTKNNVIIWNSPLSYNSSTDTASIDLSSYMTCNIVRIQNYINSNSIQDDLSFYISSNLLNKQNYINSNSHIDNLSFYISSNLLNKQNYINSNSIQDNLSFYISSNLLNKQNYINSNSHIDNLSFYISSNLLNKQNYINSNSIQDILLFYQSVPSTTSTYISSNSLTNIVSFYISSNLLNKQNYINSNSIQDNLSFYISSNLLNKQNYINSNSFQDDISFYISCNLLNKQNYINSNSHIDNLSFYISSNLLNKQNYINSNSIQDNLSHYYSSNLFASNLFFSSPIQILANTSYVNDPRTYFVPNSSLIVGDGGRLTINGNYGTKPILQAYTTIGVGDNSATGGGATNTSITLYEIGAIRYYGFASGIYNHNFVGTTYMPALSIASLAYPMPTNVLFNVGTAITADTYGNMTMNTINVGSSFSVDSNGSINIASVKSANNLVLKAPIIIDASQTATINGQSVYKYDLDLRQYTKTYLTSEGYNMRYFKITTIYSNASYTSGTNGTSYMYYFYNNYYMTDSGGLTIFCGDSATDNACNFIGNNFNYWMRNSFNYLTFINGQYATGNHKFYILIQDYLS